MRARASLAHEQNECTFVRASLKRAKRADMQATERDATHGESCSEEDGEEVRRQKEAGQEGRREEDGAQGRGEEGRAQGRGQEGRCEEGRCEEGRCEEDGGQERRGEEDRRKAHAG